MSPGQAAARQNWEQKITSQTTGFNKILDGQRLVIGKDSSTSSQLRCANLPCTVCRYVLKLFRDYVFHSVDEMGHPVLDLTHVLLALNKVSRTSLRC